MEKILFVFCLLSFFSCKDDMEAISSEDDRYYLKATWKGKAYDWKIKNESLMMSSGSVSDATQKLFKFDLR